MNINQQDKGLFAIFAGIKVIPACITCKLVISIRFISVVIPENSLNPLLELLQTKLKSPAINQSQPGLASITDSTNPRIFDRVFKYCNVL